MAEETHTENTHTENKPAEDKVNAALNLGGNIELVGFKQVSMAEVVVVKKIVGQYTRKIQEHAKNFEKISIHLKEIHKIENSSKHEVHVKALDNGKSFSSEVVDKNIFVALDSAMRKVLAEITHHNKN